jgi:hypothetical protein
METTASFEARLAPWLHSTILEGMEETAASFEARSASPSYSTIYGSGSLLCFFHTSRKNVTCMSAVPAGLRMNFWFRRPHAEARG